MNQPIESYSYFYFIGIGGIGMSALARYFNHKGKIVSGYDREATALTKELEQEGIAITYSSERDSIPHSRIGTPNNTLVVYTPAVSSEHNQLKWFSEQGFTVMKRAQVLGLITRSAQCIAIAGTHGKTTTTAWVAHILRHSGHDINAFIGGISTNYESNVLFGSENTVVIEADEFDRSFLRLSPSLAVITSTDPDHLDIYKNTDGVRQAFSEFADICKSTGKLVTKIHLPVKGDLTYGLHPSADYFADLVTVRNERFTYTLHFPDGNGVQVFSGVPGIHNVENAVSAAALCHMYGLKPDEIATGIQTFRGVKRRFELILESKKVVYIDDYAHHPTELEALLRSVRMLYPYRKVTIVFQPHLYSRTRDFYRGFAQSLSLADRVLLLDIYPAREERIEGVSEDLIYNYLTSAEKDKLSLSNLEEFIGKIRFENDVLITAGAGNISEKVQSVKNILHAQI